MHSLPGSCAAWRSTGSTTCTQTQVSMSCGWCWPLLGPQDQEAGNCYLISVVTMMPSRHFATPNPAQPHNASPLPFTVQWTPSRSPVVSPPNAPRDGVQTLMGDHVSPGVRHPRFPHFSLLSKCGFYTPALTVRNGKAMFSRNLTFDPF